MRSPAMILDEITDDLLDQLRPLRFYPPTTHVYNPLEYARAAYTRYLTLYANCPKEVILLGMNPGPWGMAQTGVPFGEIRAVKEWLCIEATVGTPPSHPSKTAGSWVQLFQERGQRQKVVGVGEGNLPDT
jgi:single-strand selective monofunctional uracil DNA glycosylase